jgi:multidrug efflux pump subunit AcrA (membrane-fusion protein)
MRQYISILIGIIVIASAAMGYKKLANSKKEKQQTVKTTIKTVQTKKIINKSIPIIIKSSGTLKAKDKIDLFTEVQGVILKGTKAFKPGTFFRQGETLLRVNSEEFSANIRSQKSNFYSVLTAMMPDLQLDFPEAYPKWHSYLSSFDIHRPLQNLPDMTTDKEKYFITGRKVLSSYYAVKNAEARLSKYQIRAPFSGVLSNTLVNVGALIRPGQKLGVFVNTSAYELEVNINSQYSNMLKKGKKVTLKNLNHTKEWIGVISRINPIIDASTQSLKVYINLKDKDLKEGMYLEVNLPVKAIENAIEIPRKLLVENSQLYTVVDSTLVLVTVEPIFFNQETVVIKGLKNEQKLVVKSIPGAYDGMRIKEDLE